MSTNRIIKIMGLMAVGCQLSVASAFAQNVGDMISGTVTDDFGPVMAANVVELDAANRIVANAVTDINGNFSFRLKNPKNKLRVTYVGYKTVTLPINKLKFDIKMVDEALIEEVVITSRKKADGSGLAIPLDEISTARQSIDMTEFEGLGITTVDEALQGRIAGLDIVANSGNLGAGSSMRLRGVSTINGSSEPLIVVDGNVLSTNTENFDFNSANEENFAQLLNVNPEDIQSISVLKDAAATAIWGSQGANGVIEIKTKRGTRGKTRVEYSYRLSATYQPQGYQMLNGDEYTMLLKEEYFNPTLSDAASNIVELNYDPSFSEYEMYNNNTDWLEAVKQMGFRQNHYVSLTGGGEKAHFRIGAGYDRETGSIITQQLDRFTSRVNLDYFVSDRIKIETNISLTYTDNKNSPHTGGLLGIAYNRMPNLSIYEQDKQGNDLGMFYHILPSVSQEFRDNQMTQNNPVALAYLAKSKNTSYDIKPEFVLRYDLLGVGEERTRLNYEGKVMFNIFNSYSDQYMPLSLITAGWNDTNGKAANRTTASSNKNFGLTTTHTLTFTPVFKNRDHSLSMMLRGQMSTGSSTSQNTTTWGTPSGTIQNTGANGIISGMGTSSGQSRSIYFTYSAHYAYKGRYMADFSVRRDGTTKFGPDKRWGNFPALSVRWNISREPWFQDVLPWVSMLSIRPGWGIVGSQPGQEYLFYSRYANGSGYLGQTSIHPNNIRLSNLKWQEKETWNLGTDFGFWDDRFTGNVELYWQYTSDLLMGNYGIPTSSGYSSFATRNVGNMENIGWEFNLNGNSIVKIGKFAADFNVTFANNRNELTKMDETCLISLNKEWDGNNGSYLSRVELNHALGSIYGFRYKGVYQYSEYSAEEVPGVSGPNAPVVRDKDGVVILDENDRTKPMMFRAGTTDYEFRGGDAIYDDVNADGSIDELDIVYLGSSLPKFTGGFGFKLRFGRLSWNNQFNFRYGNKIVNMARMNAENMYSNNNQSRAVNWRWRVEGDITSIPRALYKAGYNYLGSDRFVEDGSFIRLNYTQLNYSVDPKVLKQFGLNRLSLYVSANNLFCITKYSGADPEVGYGGYGVSSDNAQTPRAKSFTAGVTVQF